MYAFKYSTNHKTFYSITQWQSNIQHESYQSYSITETKMSLDLLERKMNAVMETGADILVTANPGCQIQLAWGVRRRGIEMEVLHLAQFLDRVFSNEPGYPTEPIAKAN